MSNKSFFGKLMDCVTKKLDKRTVPVIEVANFQGLGKRSRQEDSFLVSDMNDEELLMERGFLACVADGMGGLSDGDQVSATVTSAMRVVFYKANYDVTHDKFWENCLSLIAIDVNELKEKLQSDCGSTMVATIIHEGKLHFASVGDSRIYLIRKGKLYQLNEEHNLGNKLLHRVIDGSFDREDYEDTMGKAGLTSYFGGPSLDTRDVSYVPFDLEVEDRILLMSDGVFGTVPEDRILEVVSKNDCATAAKCLQEEVEAAGKAKQDNYTGIIIRYMGER